MYVKAELGVGYVTTICKAIAQSNIFHKPLKLLKGATLSSAK